MNGISEWGQKSAIVFAQPGQAEVSLQGVLVVVPEAKDVQCSGKNPWLSGW